MRQMTQLFKDVVDETSRIILPAGQGTSNWTMGWSAQKSYASARTTLAA